MQEFYIVRVDAAPSVEVPGGSFVTVESGPHQGLEHALHSLQNPKPRAHVLPDIVWLTSETQVWALNEAVGAKPRMVVTAGTVQQARETKTGRGLVPVPARLQAAGAGRGREREATGEHLASKRHQAAPPSGFAPQQQQQQQQLPAPHLAMLTPQQRPLQPRTMNVAAATGAGAFTPTTLQQLHRQQQHQAGALGQPPFFSFSPLQAPGMQLPFPLGLGPSPLRVVGSPAAAVPGQAPLGPVRPTLPDQPAGAAAQQVGSPTSSVVGHSADEAAPRSRQLTPEHAQQKPGLGGLAASSAQQVPQQGAAGAAGEAAVPRGAFTPAGPQQVVQPARAAQQQQQQQQGPSSPLAAGSAIGAGALTAGARAEPERPSPSSRAGDSAPGPTAAPAGWPGAAHVAPPPLGLFGVPLGWPPAMLFQPHPFMAMRPPLQLQAAQQQQQAAAQHVAQRAQQAVAKAQPAAAGRKQGQTPAEADQKGPS